MAITTTNGKYSMMSWALPFQPNVPIDSTGFPTTLQKQMLIWGQGVDVYQFVVLAQGKVSINFATDRPKITIGGAQPGVSVSGIGPKVKIECI